MKSSSYACNVNSLSKFLSLNKIEFGMKNKIQSQLDSLNEKFNKRPEMINLIKFCLENFHLKEHRENLKVMTRFENQITVDVQEFD